jgi:aspartate carbamoyltransferase regulatory subunit
MKNEDINKITLRLNIIYNYMKHKKYDKKTIDNIAKIKNSLNKFCVTNNKLNEECKPQYPIERCK